MCVQRGTDGPWCIRVIQDSFHSHNLNCSIFLKLIWRVFVSPVLEMLISWNSATVFWAAATPVAVHTVRTYRVSGILGAVILNVDTGWRWVVSLTPRLLYLLEKRARCLLYRRLRGPQSRFGQFAGKSVASAAIWTPDRPARSHV